MLRKLEKYELLEEIGHGGMATVYKARDARLDRLVAVKVLHPHLQKAPEARVRFTREARSVARLHHPNILEIYDYSGEDSEESYIAAELLTGPTLKRFVEDGPALPAEIAACFTIQIARALAAAHAEGIVHRDVKPENVLLHDGRCVKLTDFGIAQMVDAQSFTATGQILGSPGHMAPEQVAGARIDARTDVFSLGTVLYFLAVGRLPFTGRNPHQVLKRIVDAEFPDPLRVRPSIGAELARVIRRAMAREPDDRYASAAELEAALMAFLAHLDIDDPDALLRAYLAEPESTAARLQAQVLTTYTRLGRAALARKDRAAALDFFNRVLALDETNEEVLRLVDRLGRGDGRVLWVGGAAALSGLAFLAYALWGHAPAPHDPPTKPVLPPADAGQDAGSFDSGVDAADSQDAAVVVPVADAAPPPHRPRGERVRRVRLLPSPRNVRIAIDGDPPKPWGPGGLEFVELEAGSHTFEFTGDCCVSARRRVRIPRGEGVFELRQRLLFKPAGLLVRCPNCPPEARVEVRARGSAPSVRGRVGRLIQVPLSEPRELRQYRVTAPGYAPYNGTVNLRTTEPTEAEVTLQPEGAR